MIDVRGLEYRLDGKQILDIPSWKVNKGEIYVLLGPNGSGKSTFLYLLNFLKDPSRGAVTLNGEEIKTRQEVKKWRRKMALVFQEPLLFSGTVESNLEYGLKLRKVPAADIKERVEKVIGLLKLSHLKGKKSNELSGGEAQRVNLARALVVEPEIFFLDEPLANIDTPSRENFLVELKQLFRRLELSVVYVTHVREEALFLADKVGIMIDGRIVQEGKPEEVFNFPESEEVARFVGIDTVLTGKVTRRGKDRFTVDVSGFPVEVVANGSNADEAILCISPEEIFISPRKSKTTALNNFKSEIKKIYDFGHYKKVVLDAGFPLATFVSKKSVKELDLKEGDEVWASFKATSVHMIER